MFKLWYVSFTELVSPFSLFGIFEPFLYGECFPILASNRRGFVFLYPKVIWGELRKKNFPNVHSIRFTYAIYKYFSDMLKFSPCVNRISVFY